MAGLVVVGVDGSNESRKALSWAAQDARRRDADLRVVCIYEGRLGVSLYENYYVGTLWPRVVDRRAIEEHRWREHHQHSEILDAEALLDELVEDLPAELRDVPIEKLVREGSRPARLLLKAARNADLLVVGSRGCGGFTGLLLGSVSQQLAQDAPCPVVIVHGTDVVLDLTAENAASTASRQLERCVAFASRTTPCRGSPSVGRHWQGMLPAGQTP